MIYKYIANICITITNQTMQNIMIFTRSEETEQEQEQEQEQDQDQEQTEKQDPDAWYNKKPMKRLNYIGSKFQLLEWITSNILEKTGWESLSGKRIADLFAGTGVVSNYFRNNQATTFSNDAELYSSIITHAVSLSTYTNKCESLMFALNFEIDQEIHLYKKQESGITGFITKHYSPYDDCERMFFTLDNAIRIDYLRKRIEDERCNMNEDEYAFMLASLIIAADAVSNVPAVYGCYLKNFKAKALKSLQILPIHLLSIRPVQGSTVYQSDVLDDSFLENIPKALDLVYLDPPYNARQYSKNYFPLNLIAMTPDQQAAEPPLKGKTGIPVSCFTSPFCQKKGVEPAFRKLVSKLNAEWVVLSYNSESLIPKPKMIDLLQEFGTVSVVEQDYKRFKSFQYNNDKDIQEYLFILHKTRVLERA